MGNFKVRVNSQAESKEAQELFFQLGYSKGACSEGDYPADIIAVPRSFFSETPLSSRSIKLDHEEHKGYKELTLPELHDMVVLKRNDVDDATHESGFFKYVELTDGWYYFEDKWLKSSGAKPEYYEKLKPIEKTMNTLNNEHYEQPSLNDQYAEIEKVRQAIKVPDGSDSDHAIDAMSYGFMGVESDKVRQTLNERQSQYGRFKDVADTTAALMDQFALGRMSSIQREALHMICSKLARIANGDPNHVDSWHDIAGYATLVVDDLES